MTPAGRLEKFRVFKVFAEHVHVFLFTFTVLFMTSLKIQVVNFDVSMLNSLLISLSAVYHKQGNRINVTLFQSLSQSSLTNPVCVYIGFEYKPRMR